MEDGGEEHRETAARGLARAGGGDAAEHGSGAEKAAASGSPSSHAAQAAAKNYLAAVMGRPGTAADWKNAVAAGTLLLDRVGGVIAAAAEALWQARAETGLNNLKGVRSGFEGLMDPTLLEYLKEMEACGVPARSTGNRARVAARSHQSALTAGPELY